jgi:hypothetical protein
VADGVGEGTGDAPAGDGAEGDPAGEAPAGEGAAITAAALAARAWSLVTMTNVLSPWTSTKSLGPPSP